MYFRPEIAAMAGYVPGEQPQDGEFIKLNTNENPYPASPAVGRAIAATVGRLRKYPDATATLFRRRAGELLGVDPDWILCGNGSDDILTIVTRALVGPGELLRLPCPSYILYKSLAELQGARSEEILFNADWMLPPAFAENRNGLRLAIVANPNSPSGTMVSPDDLLKIAERLPCPLLIDEAYVDFADTNCVSLVARCEKIMVSRTLSKSYALAGLRFGYMVAQPHLIEQFLKVKDSYNCDALSIAGATAAIDDQAWLAENRKKIRATRGWFVAEMRKLGFVAVDSHANFTWNTHPRLAARTLYEELKRNRILVRYMNYPAWGEGLRISIGADAEMEACLSVIKGLGIRD
jgi:histidinol-phosphate aminotransferase